MDEKLQKVWKTFQFDNRIKDKLADYFSITDGYLCRRDLTRIVAVGIDSPQKGHFDYQMGPLEKAVVKAFEIKQDMKIEVKTNEGNVLLEPIQATNPYTLKHVLRKNQVFNTEVVLTNKRLKEVLQICEHKWIMERNEDPKIIFDFSKNQIQMLGREEEFDLPIAEEIKKIDEKVTYSFYLLKDMVYNKFKENISFRICDDYTLLEYDKNIYGVIAHCHNEKENV